VSLSESAELAPGTHERLLGNVLSVLVIAHEPERDALDLGPEDTYERGKRASISAGGSLHDLDECARWPMLPGGVIPSRRFRSKAPLHPDYLTIHR
jgi:hypothetical protein